MPAPCNRNVTMTINAEERALLGIVLLSYMGLNGIRLSIKLHTFARNLITICVF